MKTLMASALALTIATTALAADPEIPNTSAGSTFAPSTAVFNNELYLFFKTGKYVKTAGATWSAPITIPGSETYCLNLPQRAIAFNGKLYVFGVHCGPSAYVTLGPDGTWSPYSLIPGASGGSVGLAVFNNRLYAMWKAVSPNTSVFYASMDVSGTWSATARLSTAESRSEPSAAVLRASDGKDYLYAFWLDRNSGAQSMWYVRMDPTTLNWGATQRLNSPDWPLSELAPAATATGSGVVLAYKGGYNDNILYKKLGANQQWLAEVDTGWDLTDASPALAYFNGGTWLFYRHKWTTDGNWYVRYQMIN